MRNLISPRVRALRGAAAAASLLALRSFASLPSAAARPAPQPSEPTDEQTAAQLRDAALAGENIAWDWVSELTTRFGPRPAGSRDERASGR